MARSVVFSLVQGSVSEESIGLKDTSYAMMTPLGTAGSFHVIVIVKKEGIALKFTGPGAGVRGEIWTHRKRY